MSGRRPAELLSPESVSAMAVPPASPGYQRFEDGCGMLLSPVDGECAAVLQDNDERLASGGDGFEQVLLRGGEIDGGAVAAGEAVEMNRHLFAFERRREADEDDGDLGSFCGSDGFVAKCGGGCFPGEVDACRTGAVEIFKADGVGLGVGERDGREEGCTALGRLAGVLDDKLVVEIEAEGLSVLAGVAVVDANAEFIVAGSGRREGAGPTHGPVVALQARDGNDLVPVEVDIAIGASEHGFAAEVRSGEVFAGEAVACAVSG